jgi:hypothetical protein
MVARPQKMQGTGSGWWEKILRKILKRLERKRDFGVFLASAATLREVKA